MNSLTREIFDRAARKGQAYTFNDITIQDIPSNVLPTDASLECQVTKNYRLKRPFISAAMDTVTEKDMAVAVAKRGGLGVIHRNLSISDQVSQVEWVRRQIHNGGKIADPVTFYQTDTVADLQHIIRTHGWGFTSFPIKNAEEKLVGMVTKDELGFVDDNNPILGNIMIPLSKLHVADDSTDASSAFRIMLEKKVKKLPLVNSSGEINGMYVWADVRKNQETCNDFSLDRTGRLLVAAAVGPGEAERERIKALIDVGCPIIVIDCSHGACDAVVQQVHYIRKIGDVDIIVGNVASYQSADYLLKNCQPDAIKVGIGPSGICTTRRVTGHGIPQLTAIYEVYHALAGSDVPIIADGGITSSGDIVKALAVGANCVMLGGVLAGTDESPGEIITRGAKKYKRYRGMGSKSAMAERSGSRSRYFKGNSGTERTTNVQQAKMTPEGIDALVEYKGSVVHILTELSGGIQSGMAHSNALNISQLQKNAVCWLQTVAGNIEANPHNVVEN